MASSVASYSYSGYDAVGKVVSATQTIYGQGQTNQPYTVTYNTYDLAGHIITMTYPSGRTVTNSYDNTGRLQALTGNLGGAQRTYASGIIYDAGGRMTREQFGTTIPIYNKLFYNSRGQLAEIREGLTPNDTSWQRGAIINFYAGCWGMCWNPATQTGDSMPNNNGNLKVQQTAIPNDEDPGYENRSTEFTQSFEYDSLNRIQFTNQGNWREEYRYDQYGNRRVNTDSQLTFGLPNITGFEVETATNRLQAPGQSGWSESSRSMRYDAAGNLWKDTYSGAALGQSAIERLYDGENRMIKETQAGNYVAGEYAYDGDDRRVRRVADNVETWQVYGVGGELIAEYAANAVASNPEKEYGYRNGQLLITATGTAGWGPAPTYTGPNPLQPGDDIKLENLTELRTAVNSLRAHAGLSAYNFSIDSSPVRNETSVKADHIRQLREALEETRSRLGLTTTFAHPTPSPNVSPIYAIDFQELRNQIGSAWNSNGSVDVRWLVPDQLGTPRMIFDQSGALTSTKRHDYLPFGEELFAGTGGRTTGIGYTVQGYAPVDGARQKFTLKERDNETGLDYFGARYYGSTQGRFISADPLLSSGSIYNPQSWNRYSYTLNNPVRYTDPTGMFVWDKSLGGSSSDADLLKQKGGDALVKRRNEFRAARMAAGLFALMGTNLTAAQRGEIARGVSSYGYEGRANGVVVGTGTVTKGANAETSAGEDASGKTAFFSSTDLNQGPATVTANVRVTFGGAITMDDVAHEGSHAADRQTLAAAIQTLFNSPNPDPNANIALFPENVTKYATEFRAYQVSSALDQARVVETNFWNKGWSEVDRASHINDLLRTSPLYRVTPPGTKPGPGDPIYKEK